MPKHPDHRGKATLGERIVPLEEFERAAARHGRSLDPAGRRGARAELLRVPDDGVAVEGPFARIAVFGGVYSNHRALVALLDDATRRGAEAIYCLGDLGGFGPAPEKVWPLLEQGGVLCIQGNYEESLAGDAEDCNCGYTDPRDNRFAELSYRYTAENSSSAYRHWMGRLPLRRRVRVGARELLLVHGSPRRINEFVFRSTSPVAYLETIARAERCDGFLCTHTGLYWHRALPSGRDAINVGVIGRPANDGRPCVWYAMLEDGPTLKVEHVALSYDHVGLAHEMRNESLPGEFVETILSGWWTTCLEILPARERAASRF
ncbi:MAG: metallophosphoesterase family protein [bacterium]|nr:metallophosphoesterase family protein [bacterium]